MMYVDPKDLPIETSDALLYKAWTKRKELRLQRAQLDADIGKLDVFIETYLGMAPTPPHYVLTTQQSASVIPGPGDKLDAEVADIIRRNK